MLSSTVLSCLHSREMSQAYVSQARRVRCVFFRRWLPEPAANEIEKNWWSHATLMFRCFSLSQSVSLRDLGGLSLE